MKKTVIVTGASRGIGRAVAEVMAQKGYNVLINYNRSGDMAVELKEKLFRQGFSADVFKADVTNRCEVDEMVEYCRDRFGTVDILINNAGVSQSKLFTDITDCDWDTMMDVNLKGTFNCTQSILKYLISKKKGKIINISSIWGITGASCEVHYSAAKAGIIGLTKALAKELGPSNIQVNCVAPGVIQTDMLSEYSDDDLNLLKESTPLMRLGTVWDIAACVAFLVSEEADFITGQVISPNGGFVI
jgi:3-oxoacyl-[acyl-carrier protein] reductase